MRVLVAGGGSGGHVTPAAAVIKELKELDNQIEIRFWSDRGFADRARQIIGSLEFDIKFQTIIAGKLRRYSHLSALGHLKLPKTILLNIRDMFLVLVGTIQAFFRLVFWRPQVIFAKGGYVCLPIGFAARLLNIPLVIHDSDAHPGLTNRILAKWARAIATGAPLENYNYPKNISKYIGIPISSEFKPFTESRQAEAKQGWGMKSDQPLVVVTGGGLGAQRINSAVVQEIDKILSFSQAILITGKDQYEDVIKELGSKNRPGLRVEAFVSSKVAELLGAADAVITRAGATTLLELAALAKPIILIPNAQLTGAHQVKNAAVYAKENAALIINEDELSSNPSLLTHELKQLLNSPKEMKRMSKALFGFAKPDAAKNMAEMVYKAGIKKGS